MPKDRQYIKHHQINKDFFSIPGYAALVRARGRVFFRRKKNKSRGIMKASAGTSLSKERDVPAEDGKMKWMKKEA